MCGIVGLHGEKSDSLIGLMNSLQAHRGPDDSGTYFDRSENFSMAMRRLAIIDLQTGRQPIGTRDGRFTIIFNGEIFNAPDLRKELESKRVKFSTDHSDTEVVLQLYALEEEKMLSKLNGMFAFAIYDSQKKTLFCCRDHMGIKPFYYFSQNGFFGFSSEMKSLLALPFIRREINSRSFFHYMSLQFVPGQNTIIKGLKRLPAAHYLKYDLRSKNLEIKRWWKPIFSNSADYSKKELVEKTRFMLERAVSRWTLSDVEIACSLSGGLDSSAIVGLLAKAGNRVKTFSLGFKGMEETGWNELPRASAVAKKWGTAHRELILDSTDLLTDLISMVWHLDEPYGGGLPSFPVFQFMSREVKVGLTGTGGDEMTGNYGKWRYFRGENVSSDEFRKSFFEHFYYFSDDEKRAFLTNCSVCENTSDFLFEYFQDAESSSVKDRVAYTDLNTQLPEEFLMMTDRFSMAFSLEARTPFLDREFAEFMLSIPADRRSGKRNWNLKYLLRAAVKDLLPFSVLYGRKKGFVIPIKLWLRGPLKKLAQFLLGEERLKKQGIFTPEFYSQFVVPHLEGRKDFTNKVWTALMFQLWHFVFIEQNASDKPTYDWKNIIS